MSDYHDDDYESFDLAEDADVEGEGDLDDDDEDVDADDLDADDDDDLDDDDEELEEAAEDDVDVLLSVYRDEGEVVVAELPIDAANDLEELILQLRRLPAEAGSVGLVSLAEEVFVAVRVRGRTVQILLSDGAAANDWPLARDIADYLNLEELPDPDAEPQPVGDLGLFSDLGLSELDLYAICDDGDDTVEQLQTIADRINVGPQVRKAVEASFG